MLFYTRGLRRIGRPRRRYEKRELIQSRRSRLTATGTMRFSRESQRARLSFSFARAAVGRHPSCGHREGIPGVRGKVDDDAERCEPLGEENLRLLLECRILRIKITCDCFFTMLITIVRYDDLCTIPRIGMTQHEFLHGRRFNFMTYLVDGNIFWYE